MRIRIEVGPDAYDVLLERTPQGFRVECEGESFDAHVEDPGPPARLRLGDRTRTVDVAQDGVALLDGEPHRFHLARFEPGPSMAAPGQAKTTGVAAVMHGRLLRVLVAVGQAVHAGQPLFILEAMKMQNQLTSPAAGTVVELLAKEGDVVEAGRVLARLDGPAGAKAP